MTRGWLGARSESDLGDEDYDYVPSDEVICKYCGAGGNEWIHTGVRWRLMGADGKWHECRKEKPSADDFEVLK